MALKDLAEALVVSIQQMQKYESGANRIAAANLAIVATRLQVDLRELAGITPAVIGPVGLSARAAAVADLFDRISDTAMQDAIVGLIEAAVGTSRRGSARPQPAREPAQTE